jgi:ABC-type glycerol-3-phosphate transport system permease component
MVTLFLLTFVTQWSNFLWQLIVNTGDSAWLTLPVGLQRFKRSVRTGLGEDYGGRVLLDSADRHALPFATQKYFMQGLTAGAVKE